MKQNELTPLMKARRRYRKTRICVGSVAAGAVLFWSFSIFFVNALVSVNNTLIMLTIMEKSPVYMIIAFLGYKGMFEIFCPVGGYLADTKFGRYRIIQVSLFIMVMALFCLGMAGFFMYYTHRGYVIAGIFYTALFVYMVGLPGFKANVLQFGLDQLFQEPAQDQNLFIHWYLWLYYISIVYINVVLDTESARIRNLSFYMLMIPMFFVTFALLASFYLFCRKQKLFLIVSKYQNPYILVYEVCKYKISRKPHLHCSALNYYENEVSSGMDLAKDTCGGPYTSEQVEDVKTFFCILKIILSLFPALFIHTAERYTSKLFLVHLNTQTSNSSAELDIYTNVSSISYLTTQIAVASKEAVFGNETVFSLTAFAVMPVFVILILPLVRDYIPGMLKRIGIGIFLSIVSIATLWAIDFVIHAGNKDAGCMFSPGSSLQDVNGSNSSGYLLTIKDSQTLAKALLVFQQMLMALSHTIFYVAVYQFICSQSPHAMKGFLLGIFFASKGVLEILASLLMLPFLLKQFDYHSFLSCGMAYYSVNALVGLAGLPVYICAARRYRFRVRDEVPLISRCSRQDYYPKER